MDEQLPVNHVFLRGAMCETPQFSHENREERFYRFSMEVERLSGAVDTVHILTRARLLDELALPEPDSRAKMCVQGELRSFNNKSGEGARLVISVFARALWFEPGEDDNRVLLTGTLCKEPVHRMTPMGREICDLMLAVNRRYGRSDYLPCIAWGAAAREAALWHTGDRAQLSGRIQSRKYTKLINGESVEKTAYEVSVIELRKVIPETN